MQFGIDLRSQSKQYGLSSEKLVAFCYGYLIIFVIVLVCPFQKMMHGFLKEIDKENLDS